jgi:hypothetical protein
MNIKFLFIVLLVSEVYSLKIKNISGQNNKLMSLKTKKMLVISRGSFFVFFQEHMLEKLNSSKS